jgi:uncharacterized protein
MRQRWLELIASLLSLVASSYEWNSQSLNAPLPVLVAASYRQSFERWKSELVEDRKENWLPLAGLFWLKAGENSFGADRNNAIVFPKGPKHAGVFTRNGKEVALSLAPGVRATVAGKPVTEAILQADTSSTPTIIEMGSLRFQLIVRGERVGIRLKDVQSDAARNYRQPQFFPLDLNYRVTAKWEPATSNQRIDVPNVLGDTTPTPIPGVATFRLEGQEYGLTALEEGDKEKKLFFIFSDATNKTQTYHAGRFLKAEPALHGTVVLDFNRAYNPPCAFTPYATCPLAPKENRLSAAIPAGEKYDHRTNRQ